MTIRMELGLRRVQTAPTSSKKLKWVGVGGAGGGGGVGVGGSDSRLLTKDENNNNILSDLHYTSLCDLIAPLEKKPRSLVATTSSEWFDTSRTSFKDKLVEEAARAYLHPVAPPSNDNDTTRPMSWIKHYAQGLFQACLSFLSVRVYVNLTGVFRSIAEKLSPRLLRN